MHKILLMKSTIRFYESLARTARNYITLVVIVNIIFAHVGSTQSDDVSMISSIQYNYK